MSERPIRNGNGTTVRWLIGIVVMILLAVVGNWANGMDKRVTRIEEKVDQLLIRQGGYK